MAVKVFASAVFSFMGFILVIDEIALNGSEGNQELEAKDSGQYAR